MSELNREQQQLLLRLARHAITNHLERQQTFTVNSRDFPEALQRMRSSFVTLTVSAGDKLTQGHRLRGCIGSLVATEPLVVDVVKHAQAAAFNDPRFPPLHAEELTQIQIEISVLSPQSPLPCRSEAELLAALQPQRDGLVLKDGNRQATFLPSVWEQLPDPAEFVAQLKQKAGLAHHYWSDSLQVFRYHTESFAESAFL